MSQTYVIPLVAGPQRVQVQLGSRQWGLILTYCHAADSHCWLMEIQDDTGRTIAAGIPLVTDGDLVAQYAYLGVPGKFLAVRDGSDSPPQFADLGSTGRLLWVSP